MSLVQTTGRLISTDLLDKNPILRIGPPNLANIALEALIARMTQSKHAAAVPEDYLQHFLTCKTTHLARGPSRRRHRAGLPTRQHPRGRAPRLNRHHDDRAVLYSCLKHHETVYRRLGGGRGRRARGDAPPPGRGDAAGEDMCPKRGLALPDGWSCVPAGTVARVNAYVVQRNKGL
ncbi:hypothetical protein C8A03DRAFT_33426 [Achaetomium macrosporum]|uniref:Uncharacterized protein n=1 Tax=Achaetomium macrosporum TaxID=79813 RepID=A0AAN7HCL0_9PEZI|nr:hypothetical protein C8A03DRAFT_33426 [Achaetomium macrosporum]